MPGNWRKLVMHDKSTSTETEFVGMDNWSEEQLKEFGEWVKREWRKYGDLLPPKKNLNMRRRN